MSEPTADTSLAFDEVTPVKAAFEPGDGLGTTDHAVPLNGIEKLSNCSFAESRKVPTARTSFGPSAEIASSVVLVGAFGGTGTVTLDQAVPSQCARWPRGMELLFPTA